MITIASYTSEKASNLVVLLDHSIMYTFLRTVFYTKRCIFRFITVQTLLTCTNPKHYYHSRFNTGWEGKQDAGLHYLGVLVL